MRVAVGMEDENELESGHYGDSKFFLIYEFDNGKLRYIERRNNKAVMMEENEHGDINKFRAVIAQLQDIDVLIAYRMGPNFVRIKENTSKKVFFARTRDLNTALDRFVKEFDKVK